MNKFFVYILRCSDDTLYYGWTTDIDKRVSTHNAGKGAKYTRSRRPVKLVHVEEFADKRSAMSREWRIKHMSRAEKLKLLETAEQDEQNLRILSNKLLQAEYRAAGT